MQLSRRTAVLAALCLLSAGCASSRSAQSAPPPAAPARSAAKAFLWEARKGDQVLHLVGSVHLGREGALKPAPSMLAAFETSDVLVVELDVTRQDPAALQSVVATKGFIPAGQPGLFEQLGEADRKKLQQIALDGGLPPERMDRMRPWLANMMVTMLEVMAKPKPAAEGEAKPASTAPATGGFDPSQGVDFQFLSLAHGKKKEIVELETADGQISALASLPEKDQLKLLEQLLKTGKGVATQVAVAANETWSEGDAQRLDHELLDDVRKPEFASLYKIMFTDRNRAMTARLLQLAATPKRHFVVVGAGHIIGRDGILELLEQEGFTVRQLARE